MPNAWLIWLIFAAIFLIAEIFTAGFFLLWFGVGAGVASAVAALGLSGIWQWSAFIIVSGVLVILTRPLAERLSRKQPPGVGADRFVGQMGIVVQEINPQQAKGMVRIKTDEWRADSQDGSIIAEGEKVEVVGVDGTHLIVRKIT